MSAIGTEDGMRILYLALLVTVLGSALVAEFAGRRSQALRQMAVWAMIFGVAIAAALWWQGRQQARQQSVDGRRIELLAGPDGHFQLTAEVNGVEVPFVVDTGASDIALSQRDAERIGFDPAQLVYTERALTANGEIRTAPVTLQMVRIGDIVDERVAASVGEGDIHVSLLGMSYLRRFSRVAFEGDVMVLER